MGGVVSRKSQASESARENENFTSIDNDKKPTTKRYSRQRKSIKEHYDLGETLGEGSFAEVFLAKPTLDHRINYEKTFKDSLPSNVAIKKITKSDVMTEDIVQQEIRILASVQHNRIVKFYEQFENQGFFFLVLECMKGGELFEYILARNCLSEREAADIVKQVAEALDFLHSNCIVHRDIKPENILFQHSYDSPHIKLTDFGLAEKVSAKGKCELNTPCGTPGYVAPEILNRAKYGEKVDVWSLGVILYILLCGYPPFYSENQLELFEQIKAGEYVFEDPYWSNISEQAVSTVSKILIVNVKERVDASEVLELPWVKHAARQNAEQLGNHVVEGINEVKKDKKLHKVALALNVISAFKSDHAAASLVDKLKRSNVPKAGADRCQKSENIQ